MLSTDVGAAPAAATRLQESAPAPGTVARRESRTTGQDDNFGEMFDRFADESTPAGNGRTAPQKGAPTPGLPQPVVSTADDASTEEGPSGRGVGLGILGALPTWEPESPADEPMVDLAATVPVFEPRLIAATQLQPQARADAPGVAIQGQTRGGERQGPGVWPSPGQPVLDLAQAASGSSTAPVGLFTIGAVPPPSVDGLPVPEQTLFTIAEANADGGELTAVPGAEAQTVPLTDWQVPESAVAFGAPPPPLGSGLTPTAAPPVAPGAITPDIATPRQVAMAAIRSALTRELDTAAPSATPATPPATLPSVPAANGTAPTVPDALATAPAKAPLAPVSEEAGQRAVAVPASRADLQPPIASGAPAVATPAAPPSMPGAAVKAPPVVKAAPVVTPPPVADALPQAPGTASVAVTSAVQAAEPGTETGVDAETAGDASSGTRPAQKHAAPAGPAAALSIETPGAQNVATPGRKGAQTNDAPPVSARPSARVAHAIAAFQAASVTGLGAAAAAVQTPVSVALPDTLLDQELPTQIVQAIRVRFEQGSGEARLRLNPGFLGGMTVGVQVDGTSVVASLYASSADVRDWMQRNEQVLRQSLADQGLQLERLVIVDEEAPAAADDERGRGQREQQEQQSSRRPRRPVEEGTFELVL